LNRKTDEALDDFEMDVDLKFDSSELEQLEALEQFRNDLVRDANSRLMENNRK
jgi:hypothetical protein